MKIVYLDEDCLNDRSIETLRQLQEGNHSGVSLEKLNGYKIWSIRVNDADRILLTLCRVGNETCWLVLDFVPNHDYNKSKFLKSQILVRFLEKNATALNEITLTDFNVEKNPEIITQSADKISQFRKVHHYNDEYICLNDVQHYFFDKTFPLVLSGMPGSGKTCMGFILLKNYIKQTQGVAARALYVTKSASLSNNMKNNWNGLIDLPQDSSVAVTFLSYAELLGHCLNGEKVDYIDFTHFQTWIKRQKTKLDAETVYQEFQTISVCDSFEKYNTRFGVRTSLFVESEDKKEAYDLYQRYDEFCKTNHLVDILFYTIKAQELFDFIFVDESQILSHIQLRNLLGLAKSQQICYAMDSNQKSNQGSSNRPFLLQLLCERANINTAHYILSQTFRNPEHVVDFANAVLRLKNVINGGVSDLDEYTQAVANPENQETGAVQWLTEATPDLIALTKNVDCAVVVANEESKQKAFALFNTPLLFTQDEIQGLQFKKIILFDPFSIPEFAKINKLIPEDIATRTLIKNRPKNKEDKSTQQHTPTLNALYTSITRSSSSVFVVAAETHAAAKLTQYLKSSTQLQPEKIAIVSQPESSESEWYEKAIELEANGKTAQAEAIFNVKLKKATPQKKNVAARVISTESKATTSNVINKPVYTPEQIQVNDFLDAPTAEKFKKMVTCKDVNKLIFIVKTRLGVSLAEDMRKDIWKYLETFIQTDEALMMFHCMVSDKGVQTQLQLPRKQFYSDRLFGRFCTSIIGWVVLSLAYSLTPKLIDDLLEKKNAQYFWSKVPLMMQHQEGRDVMQVLIEKHPELILTLSHKQLFTDKLFQYLCLEANAVELLLKLFMQKKQMVANMDADVLLTPFFGGYDGFTLLSSTLEGTQLLATILANNPAVFSKVEATTLFKKHKYAYHCKANQYRALDLKLIKNIMVTMVADFKVIEVSVFHQLAVSANDGIKLLYSLMGSVPGANMLVTVADLCGQPDKGQSLLAHVPLYYMCLLREGAKFITKLFSANPDLLPNMPVTAFFTKPTWIEKGMRNVQPAIFHLLWDDQGALFTQYLLSKRQDMIPLFIACLANPRESQDLSDTNGTALLGLVRTEAGRATLMYLVKNHRSLMQAMNWNNINVIYHDKHPGGKYAGLNAFCFLMQSATAFLNELMGLIPPVAASITAASLFSAVTFEDERHATFRHYCVDVKKQLILLKIFKANADICQKITAELLFGVKRLDGNEDQDTGCAAELLHRYPPGQAILDIILSARTDLQEQFTQLNNKNQVVILTP